MKTSTTKLFIVFTLIFGIFGCTEDEPVGDIAVENKKQIIVKELRKEEFPHKLEVENKLDNLIFPSSNNQLEKASYSEETNSIYSDLKIIDQQANYVELPNGFYSYTFNTYRENTETDKLENIVLVSNGVDEFNAFYVEYTLTEEEKEQLTNNGFIEGSEITYTSTLLNNEELEQIYQATSDGSDCKYSTDYIFYKNGCVFTTYTEPSCEVRRILWCPTEDEILDSEDTSGGGGGFDWSNWGNPNPNPGFTGGGGAGSFTPGGTPNTNPEDVNENNSNTGTSNEIGDILVTNPNLTIDKKTPNCKELEKDGENSEFKQHTQTLKDNLEEDFEKGFNVYYTDANDPYFVPNPIITGTEDEIDFGEHNLYRKGVSHNHNKNKHPIVFSPKDLVTFIQYTHYAVLNQSPLKMEQFVQYLVTDKGTFAIKLSDVDKLWNNFAEKYASDSPWYNKRFKREFDKFYKEKKMVQGETETIQLTGFLKLIKEYNLGIELYKADASLENWEQLTLDDNEEIIKTPC